jgi:hypothetical protein
MAFCLYPGGSVIVRFGSVRLRRNRSPDLDAEAVDLLHRDFKFYHFPSGQSRT